MGARIFGAGFRRITVDGVEHLGGRYLPGMPDRIEPARFLVVRGERGETKLKGTRAGILDRFWASCARRVRTSSTTRLDRASTNGKLRS